MESITATILVIKLSAILRLKLTFQFKSIVYIGIISTYLRTCIEDVLNRLINNINLTWDSRTLDEICNSRNYHIYDDDIIALAAKRIKLKANIIIQLRLITCFNCIRRFKEYHEIFRKFCKIKKQIKSKRVKFDWKINFADLCCHKLDRPHYNDLEKSFIQDKPLFSIKEWESQNSQLCLNDDVHSISKTRTWANWNQDFRYMIQLYFWSKSFWQIYQHLWFIKITVLKLF